MAAMISFSRFTRYFAEVARLGSIRKASEALHVSASAIDRQILMAEEELGVKLFERLPGGLRLSAAGEILMASTRRWQKDYSRLLDEIADLEGLRQGHVEIAAIDALADVLIPEALARIAAEFPHVTFGLKVRDNAEIAGMIVSGAVDFGLMLEPFATRELDIRAFVEIPLGLVVPPGHPFERQAGIRFNQTAGEPMVLPGPTLAIHEQVAVLSAATRVAPDRRLVCDNVQMIKSLVRRGSGVGILSWLDVVSDVAAGTLRFVPLTDPVLTRISLALCMEPRRQLSKAANIAFRYIEQELARLEPPGR